MRAKLEKKTTSRPPGRPKFAAGRASFSLTERQQRWLDAQSNASESVRQLIDAAIAADKSFHPWPSELYEIESDGQTLLASKERFDAFCSEHSLSINASDHLEYEYVAVYDNDTAIYAGYSELVFVGHNDETDSYSVVHPLQRDDRLFVTLSNEESLVVEALRELGRSQEEIFRQFLSLMNAIIG